MMRPTDTAELLAKRTVEYDETGAPTRARRTYQVLRALTASEFTLASISGLPSPGSAHPVFGGLVVTSYDVREGERGARWEVDVLYERPSAMSGVSGGMRVVSVSVGASSETRDLTHDAATSRYGHSIGAGAPILNSAGDPFDEAIRVEIPIIEITVVRDENTPYASRMAYHGTVNMHEVSVAGFTIGPHRGRLLVSGDASDSADYAYRYTYRVQIRKNVVQIEWGGDVADIGWEEAVLDQGYYYLDGDDRVRATEVVRDENGVERVVVSSKPVLLDGLGRRSDYPYYHCVCPYPEASWSALALPTGS